MDPSPGEPRKQGDRSRAQRGGHLARTLQSLPALEGRSRPWRLRTALRITLWMTALLAATAALQGALLTRLSHDELVKRERAHLRSRVRSAARALAPGFEALRRNVLALAQTPPIEGIIETERHGGSYGSSTTEEWRQRLGVIFSGLLTANPEFTQVRYVRIGSCGREIVRVGRGPRGDARVTPESELQCKGHRYYMERAQALPAGSVYLSDIDLNREHGKVVEPPAPTLRAVTPVVAPSGERFGAVVINVAADRWLERMIPEPDASDADATGLQSFVADARGNYLLHPDPSRRFGHALGHTRELLHDAPSLAPFLAASTRRAVDVRDGAQLLSAAQVHFDPTDSSRFLVVAYTAPEAALLAGASDMAHLSLLVTLAMVAAAIALGLYLSRPLTQLLRAAERIAAGDLKPGLPSARAQPEDLAVLGRALRAMTHAVEVRDASLAEQKLTTEAIVESMGSAILTLGDDGSVKARNQVAKDLLKAVGSDWLQQLLCNWPLPEAKAGSPPSESREVELAAAGDEHPFLLTRTWVELERGRRAVFLLTDLSDLRQADRARRDFVAVVSHELRTPLSSIRGSLALLRGGVLGEMPPEAASVLSIADRNCARLAGLVDDILDFEAAAQRAAPAQLEPVAMAGLLSEALEVNEPYARRLEVQLRLAPDPDDAVVLADRAGLSRVLCNLLSNAAKFSSPGSHVEVGCQRVDGRARVSVEDHGCGIPEATRGRIFEAFVQADNTSVRKHAGTGLGLSIARQLVERMGGEIWVESQEGKGSTFFVELRLAEEERRGRGQGPPSPSAA